MFRFIKICVFSLLLVYGMMRPAQAQSVPERDSIRTETSSRFLLDTLAKKYIWFRNDVRKVDLDYMDNRASVSFITETLSGIDRDSLKAISSILIEGASSPLGNETYNARLSELRARAVANYLRTIPGVDDSIDIQIIAKGEDWETFTEDVRQNYHRRNREQLLELLESDLSDREKETRLMALEPDSLTWWYLVRNNMKSSRNASTVVIIKKKRIVDYLPVLTSVTARVEPLYQSTLRREDRPEVLEEETPVTSEEDVQEPSRKPLLLTARTNLLAPALNFGAEYPIGTHWSIGADYYYPWAKRNPDNRNCFQLLGWGLEGRYWFGKNRTLDDLLQGHSVGLNTSAGYYDIENEFAGNQGTFVSVGADYLYSLPIFKDKMHLEFTIGLGYIFSRMTPYDVFESGGLAYKTGYTMDFHWVGPTKAGVSLVVPIRAKRRAER